MSEIQAIEAAIAVIDETWITVDTNDGTFGPEEAARLIGTGDPKFAVWRVLRTANGRERIDNPDAREAGVGYGQAPMTDGKPGEMPGAAAKLEQLRADRKGLLLRLEAARAKA
jgi:hypothetical protein